MHCQYLNEERDSLSREIENLERLYGINIISPVENNLFTLLGKVPDIDNAEMMLQFYRIVATNVHMMYCKVLRTREGIG